MEQYYRKIIIMTTKRSLEDIYPLSPMQAGLLFQALRMPNSDAYLVQDVFQLKNTDQRT